MFATIITTLLFYSSLILATESITIVPRSSKLENFPCSQCHKTGVFKNKIELPLKLQHLSFQTKHMEGEENCYACHNKLNFDQFTLLTGRNIEFDESHLLCWQCHGDKKADWQSGLHGKQTGFWDGEKKKVTCTACHNAHIPKFGQVTPERAPELPKLGTRNKRGSHE